MIISYIISQNNNIPRIKKGIEAVCDRYKAVICKDEQDNLEKTENEIYGFPHLTDIEKTEADRVLVNSDLDTVMSIYGLCVNMSMKIKSFLIISESVIMSKA